MGRTALARRGDPHVARAAAWLCRRHTEAPLRERAPPGLPRADGVPDLTRRIDARLRTPPRLTTDRRKTIEGTRMETGNKV